MYDSILYLSFGGPEKMDDVLPFLENVLRGKGVPRERMLEVAEHYRHFDGYSPINDQNKEIIASLKLALKENNIDLPIYFGNRNWHPLLPDTLKEIRDAGHKNTLVYITSGFSCYSGCRQYKENLEAATNLIENGPKLTKLRSFYNHPGFVGANSAQVKAGLKLLDSPEKVYFTAHSIPLSMAKTSEYEKQLLEVCGLIAEDCCIDNWELVYQSRSGPPQQPWLEPDICDKIEEDLEVGLIKKQILVHPVGFLSDHLEVLFDLDTEVQELCDEKGLKLVRSKTVHNHPLMIQTIVKLIQEKISGTTPEARGQYPPRMSCGGPNCCAYSPGSRPQRPV
ncbi:MAG: ferrochelatase [Lentisphaeria bacterium]|nr:ferrochelatase [Lentisphaeria bacterium]